MTIYLYWGEDEFALSQAIATLKQQVLDPDWASFNFSRIGPDQADGVFAALTEAMTPPFGLGQRLVWLVEPPFLQTCPEGVAQELERTLPQLPETSVLLITSKAKPNGRLKTTKFLEKQAQTQAFDLIPPWKTDQLEDLVRQVAKAKGVRLTRASGEFLVEAVGGDTRQLYNELEKLSLYGSTRPEPLEVDLVEQLVTTSTQSSFKLAEAIRDGHSDRALGLLSDLLNRNEAPLRIVATLVGQFRSWLWVKLLMADGERDDKAIALAAGISNPKRLYFLKQSLRHLSHTQLLKTLPLLLSLEEQLKHGYDERACLQTKILELCHICQAP